MHETGQALMGMSGLLLLLCALAAVWPGSRRQVRTLATLAFLAFVAGAMLFLGTPPAGGK